MPSFQKFKASGDKKKKRRAKAPSKDKGLKQKQKQKVIVNVSAGSGGGGGYIPMPQAPDYGSIASMISSLRPTATQDVQLRQAPVYEPAPVKQEETVKSMIPEVKAEAFEGIPMTQEDIEKLKIEARKRGKYKIKVGGGMEGLKMD